jgi:hypothetical protein
MINIQQIRDTIFQIFSEDGYVKNNVTVKFPELLNVSITKNDTDINIDFKESLPYISWKKLITLSAYINGFTLGETGGTIKLKYLPDITFSYEKTQEIMANMLEENFGNVDFSDIESEINQNFKDEERKKLAQRCLQYGIEWSRIASQSCNFKCADENQKKLLKKECTNFIKQNILEEKKYGSVVLTFILVYVLLPVVLKFIVERIFRKLFS